MVDENIYNVNDIRIKLMSFCLPSCFSQAVAVISFKTENMLPLEKRVNKPHHVSSPPFPQLHSFFSGYFSVPLVLHYKLKAAALNFIHTPSCRPAC
jgi:hypothetical protein